MRAIAERLDRGEQSLLFVNRRGFAPVVLCHACGWVAECRRCDASLVLHAASRRLRCHHCGLEQPPPPVCPACAGDELIALGSGTERVSALLANRFAGARVARIDRDTTRNRDALSNVLEEVRTHRVDIVVGTQMIAKGHHLPGVSLVGVLETDGGLYSTDFRAPERMAQLIVQVAGRAGRGTVPGEVIIQTHHPGHPLLDSLRHLDYPSFALAALREREEAGLPPFSALALLRAEATAREPVFEFLGQARDLAETMARPAGGAGSRALPVHQSAGGFIILGPAAAPMERRGGRYRAQLLIQCGRRSTLHRFLEPWLETIGGLEAARRVRWSLDVDPQEMF